MEIGDQHLPDAKHGAENREKADRHQPIHDAVLGWTVAGDEDIHESESL